MQQSSLADRIDAAVDRVVDVVKWVLIIAGAAAFFVAGLVFVAWLV
jgi:hypothetical protein